MFGLLIGLAAGYMLLLAVRALLKCLRPGAVRRETRPLPEAAPHKKTMV